MVALTEYLQKSRQSVLDDDASMNSFGTVYYSGTTYSLWKSARHLTARYSRGIVLDAGSGRGGWREIIEENGATREALDWQQLEGERLDWVGDLTDMPQVPSDRFDSSVCHQVLEHIDRPIHALREINRVLKPGGHLVVSAPHLSRLHELPHDYFRYTPGGLCKMAEQTGYDVVQVTTYGGLLTFLHHQFSTVFVGLMSFSRLSRRAAIAINMPLSVAATWLDNVIDRKHYMPNGVIAVLRKK